MGDIENPDVEGQVDDQGVEGEESPTSGDDPAAEPTGVQKRINQLTGRMRQAEREADYWRGVAEGRNAQPSGQQEPAQPRKKLDPNDFNSDAEYLEAVAEQHKKELRAEIERERQQDAERERQAAIAKSAEAARKKYNDFDEVALDPTLPVTQHMYDAAIGENLGDVLYHLGKNPAEARRISQLSTTQQVKEIGKIEARLTAQPATKRTTNAPTPPPKVGGGGSTPEKDVFKLPREERFAKWEAERRKSLGVK